MTRLFDGTLLAAALVFSAVAIVPAEQAAAQVPRERTFIMAGQADGPTFRSPGIANPYSVTAEIRSGPLQVFEPLFFYNVYTDTHIPWIATGYDLSDDFKTITIHIRDGVKWSDGVAFTAEDVAFTINLLLKNAAGAGDMKGAKDLAQRVDHVDVIDPLTVAISLLKPDPRFIYTHLTNHMAQGLFWLPEHIWKDVENPAEFRNFDPEKGLPLTTGAWKLVESTPSQNVLIRRDDWWGATTGFRPLPPEERIVGVPFGTPDKGAQMISTNAVDITIDYGQPALLKRIEQLNPNVTTFGKAADGTPTGSLDFWPTSLYFNHKDPMWADVRLRKAIAKAIDRQQAVDIAYGGANPPTITPFPAFEPLLPAIAISEEIAKKDGLAEQDLDGSAALMQEMGYARNGDGIWEKDGKTIKATIHGVPPMRDIGPIIAQQLRNAGFDIDFASTADSRTIIRQGKAQLALFGHFGSIQDPAETLNIYNCRNAVEPGSPTDSVARWCNEDFSKLADEIYNYAPSDPKVLELVKQAMEIWYGDVVEVPISQWKHLIPLNQTYWTNWPSDQDPYISPAFWYASGEGIYLLHNLKAVK
jgi:peptide/nickel transport system substrate-binding protein